jgi:predicted nuclease of restriction endonuclease-like RecB superfamily
VLTKDLLQVSRRGGGYQPQFADASHEELAARVIGCYQGHVDQPRERLQEALTEIERESDDFKLVRGFSKLLDRDATWEIRSPVDPERARKAAFAAGEAVGVVTEDDRGRALDRAADHLGTTPEAVKRSLYADLDRREVLSTVEPRWDPADLVTRYNLSLAQTALFDATETRIRSSDPRALVSAVKRLGLMYEVYSGSADGGAGASGSTGDRERGDWELVVTGPDSLFRSTRRYGTQFARLLRTVAVTADWRLTATVDDRGTERTMQLSDDDPVTVSGADPIAGDRFDSTVEAEFATRFRSLDFDWTLVREPEPLEAGRRVMIPDFAFEHEYADFRVFFEIMGFWTPEYVEKKLGQLDAVEGVEMLVAVDESLGVGEEVAARDHRAITYSRSIRLKDVRGALRPYEQQLATAAAADLPDDIRPEADVVTLDALAAEYGVSESVVEDAFFPDHERVGRTLVRPAVLEDLADEVAAGLSLAEAEAVLDEYGIEDASATLSALGYRVEWEGLDGGTVRERE